MNKIETPSGTVFKINEPEISGSLPIRNEVQVQPAGQQKGWVCYIDNSDPEILDPITKQTISELKLDQEVLVQTLFGLLKMTVTEIEKTQAIAETKDSLNDLHFDYEHGIWRSEPILINKKLLRNTCARNKIP